MFFILFQINVMEALPYISTVRYVKILEKYSESLHTN